MALHRIALCQQSTSASIVVSQICAWEEGISNPPIKDFYTKNPTGHIARYIRDNGNSFDVKDGVHYFLFSNIGVMDL